MLQFVYLIFYFTINDNTNHSESDAFLTTSGKQDSHFSHEKESHSGMLDQF